MFFRKIDLNEILAERKKQEEELKKGKYKFAISEDDHIIIVNDDFTKVVSIEEHREEDIDEDRISFWTNRFGWVPIKAKG